MSTNEPIVEFDGHQATFIVPSIRTKSDQEEILLDLGGLRKVLPECHNWTIDLSSVSNIPLALLGQLREYQREFQGKGGAVRLILSDRNNVAPSLLNSLLMVFDVESATSSVQ